MVKRNYIHYIYIIYIVVFAGATLFFSACSHPEYRRELTDADSLASVNPSRAKAILDSIAGEMASAPEHEQMYYELLRIKAADKAFIVHTSDSSILTVVKYYEKHDDKSMLPQAYYYAGSVYRDLNDLPQALEYYQKAESALDIESDSFLLSRIYSQEAFIFLTQNLYNLALDANFKAYKLNKAQKDTVSIIYNLRNMAYIYGEIGQKIKCLYFYNKALMLAKESNNKEAYMNVESQMAAFYINNKEYDKALYCLKKYLGDKDNINRGPFCNMAAQSYDKKVKCGRIW